jgi:mannan endo-1,4-beta-mannosidase
MPSLKWNAIMRFSIQMITHVVFATSAFALPSLLSLSDTSQPAVAYPIGRAGGTNAKASRRLFEIDGKIEYFAGWSVLNNGLQ